jgi:hypothetical protein
MLKRLATNVALGLRHACDMDACFALGTKLSLVGKYYFVLTNFALNAGDLHNGCFLTSQAQRRPPRDASIATVMRCRRSLQRLVELSILNPVSTVNFKNYLATQPGRILTAPSPPSERRIYAAAPGEPRKPPRPGAPAARAWEGRASRNPKRAQVATDAPPPSCSHDSATA